MKPYQTWRKLWVYSQTSNQQDNVWTKPILTNKLSYVQKNWRQWDLKVPVTLLRNAHLVHQPVSRKMPALSLMTSPMVSILPRHLSLDFGPQIFQRPFACYFYNTERSVNVGDRSFFACDRQVVSFSTLKCCFLDRK